MDISVIVPLFNEEESLPELFAWIKRVMDTNDFTYEVIFVNDGSTDRSWNVIEELAEKFEQVKGIKFPATTERVRHSIVDSRRHREMLSSPWMQTCRILLMRFRDSTR